MYLSGNRLVTRKHAQSPQGQASRHLHLVHILRGHGSFATRGSKLHAPNLKIPEMRGGLGPVANKHQLDLGQDEAVPAPVLAHDVVQVREAAQILDPLDVSLDAHARVEAVKGLDEPDDARGGLAAEDGGHAVGGGFAGYVGDEHVVRCCCGCGGSTGGDGGHGALGGNGELERALRAEGQGGVELGEVVSRVDGVQRGFGLGVAVVERRGRGEESLRDGHREAGGGAGDGEDGSRGEVVPGANLSDVPPEVLGMGIPKREGDGADERRSRVRRGEVG